MGLPVLFGFCQKFKHVHVIMAIIGVTTSGTLCLLMSYAKNLCKQFGPRSG